MRNQRYSQYDLNRLALQEANDAQFEKLAKMLKAGWAVNKVTNVTLAGCPKGDANIWIEYRGHTSPGQARSGCLRPDGSFARPAINQKGKFTVPRPTGDTAPRVLTPEQRRAIIAA